MSKNAGNSLHCQEITKRILEAGIWHTEGRTPSATTNARLAVDVTKNAIYARLYGLTRDELRYLLDPSDTHGGDYPTETFRGLKAKELAQHGEYRTRRLILEAWDRLHE